MAQRMEHLAAINTGVIAHAKTTSICAPALSVRMASSPSQQLLLQTVCSVTVIMVEAGRRSVKKKMVGGNMMSDYTIKG